MPFYGMDRYLTPQSEFSGPSLTKYAEASKHIDVYCDHSQCIAAPGAAWKKELMGFYDIEWANCIQITMRQKLNNQMVINRFFYQSIGSYVASPAWIAQTWFDTWLAVAEPLQSYLCTYEEVIVLQLDSPGQQASFYPTASNGSDTGAVLPAFMAHYFREVASDSRIKKGRKAISGVTEPMVDGEGLASGFTAIAAAFAAFLADALLVDDDTFYPVLLSPANTRHTGDLSSVITAATWVSWSTQSSRKAGRGS